MGNRICRARRSAVEERYTRPQRLVRQPSNVDYKKLRKLILAEKLAPCFDGAEDSTPNSDLEECPICFFFYPSLNRSRCCSKGICTECFLQMNPSNAIRPAQCPFCKTSSYAVEYRGAKTQEEKGLEQAEEQKVIEAKIRMQFQESQITDQAVSTIQNSSVGDVQSPAETSMEHPNESEGWTREERDSDPSLHAGGNEVARSPFLNAWNERNAEFGLDLEEIMLMEAIWQSIQDTNLQNSTQQRSESNGMGGCESDTYGSNHNISRVAMTDQEVCSSLDSITGGVAVAIAKLAERNILHSGAFHSTQEVAQTSQTQDENSLGHHVPMLSTITHGANRLQMESVDDSGFNEAGSEQDCLASYNTDDDSLHSPPAPDFFPDDNPGSEDGFSSDEHLLEEMMDNTSSFSSLHTLSDVSYESPGYPDMQVNSNHILLSDPIPAVRHQSTYAQFYS